MTLAYSSHVQRAMSFVELSEYSALPWQYEHSERLPRHLRHVTFGSAVRSIWAYIHKIEKWSSAQTQACGSKMGFSQVFRVTLLN
jgi:hypothetical protein